MEFNDLKKLCKEHDNLLEISNIINENTQRGHWFKVETPNCGSFYLDDELIKSIKKHYEKRGLEIEITIYNLLHSEVKEDADTLPNL